MYSLDISIKTDSGDQVFSLNVPKIEAKEIVMPKQDQPDLESVAFYISQLITEQKISQLRISR